MRTNQPIRWIPVDADMHYTTPLAATKTSVTTKFHKPEPGDLRGIPVTAPGVGGVQPGTNPEQATIAKLTKQERHRAA